MGGARVSVMNILLAVVVLLGLEARAQTDKICTAANKDPSHCICNTPNGAIDVTSLGDANGFTKYTLKDNNGNTYDFDPCYGLTDNSESCLDTVACQTGPDGATYGLGHTDTGQFYYDNNSKASYLLYTDGLDSRQSRVNLVCNKSQDTPLAKADGDAKIPLTYVFSIAHRCACPGECHGDTTAVTSTSANGGIPAGGIAGIAVGVLLLLMSTGCAAVGLCLFIGAVVIVAKNKSGTKYEPL